MDYLFYGKEILYRRFKMDYKRVLVLRFTNGMSSREIAEATGDGKSTINDFLKRFRECGVLTYPLPEDVTNEFIAP